MLRILDLCLLFNPIAMQGKVTYQCRISSLIFDDPGRDGQAKLLTRPATWPERRFVEIGHWNLVF